MYVNSKNAVWLMYVAVFLSMLFVNTDMYKILFSIFVLYTCIKSISGLYIYNFASDEMVERYECYINKAVSITKMGMVFGRVKNILLNVLTVMFFVNSSINVEMTALKIISVIVAILWTADLVKMIRSYIYVDNYEEWTLKDSIMEMMMWAQNILSIIVVVSIL